MDSHLLLLFFHLGSYYSIWEEGNQPRKSKSQSKKNGINKNKEVKNYSYCGETS